MALPLIYAAGATVARFIAKNGIKAAAKKYTKKAIADGKKHAKDLVTKKTTGQKQTTSATKGQRTYRAGQRVALGTGVAATSAVTTTSSNSKKTKLRKKNAELRMKLEKEKSKPTISAPKTSPKPKARPSKNAPKTSPRPKIISNTLRMVNEEERRKKKSLQKLLKEMERDEKRAEERHKKFFENWEQPKTKLKKSTSSKNAPKKSLRPKARPVDKSPRAEKKK